MKRLTLLLRIALSPPGFTQSGHRAGGHKRALEPGKARRQRRQRSTRAGSALGNGAGALRSQGLKPQEIQLVNKLVEANRDIEYIYWWQSDPEALTLYQSLKGA